MENIDTIHDRISKLVATFADGKNTVFASMIGTNEGNIRGYIRGIMPKQDILEKIVRCIDVDADWLLTGRRNMSKKEVFDIRQSSVSDNGTFIDRLLHMLQEKDKQLQEQAEEIGSLKQQIKQLEKEKGRLASAVASSGIANAG